MMRDERTKELIAYIKNKRTKDGKWKNNFKYKADGYLAFDKDKKESQWTTHIIEQHLL